jgi:hypothetical protein
LLILIITAAAQRRRDEMGEALVVASGNGDAQEIEKINKRLTEVMMREAFEQILRGDGAPSSHQG